jgi:hypothetical protein
MRRDVEFRLDHVYFPENMILSEMVLPVFFLSCTAWTNHFLSKLENSGAKNSFLIKFNPG